MAPPATPTAAANLSLTKTVDNASPGIGDVVTFTITLTNGGPAEATNVTVNDLLPAGLSFVDATGTPQTIDEVSKALTIVDGDTIALRADRSVGDALRDVPGQSRR